MGLAPGTRLGAYEVTAQIGEGGMGQVFRATDTKLKRQVAIKILPPSMATDPERLARFQREAEVLASLNHPHIAGIYGLEEGGGRTALVMELVDGEDLAQRIARGAIPIDEALPIAKQIAEALEAAHEQGIIHRDLKPANIKVRPDGTVKVLDFGLAKALDSAPTAIDASHSPTITSPAMLSGVGMILGTAAYMSPEQARGKAVDKRTDIWAFGCVLYEMLTGEQSFRGDTITDVLASIVKNEPDLNKVPALARRLLRACLEKDASHRLRAIGDAWLLLDDDATTWPAGPRLSWALLTVLSLGVVAIGAAATWARGRQPIVERRPFQFQVNLPEGVRFLEGSYGGSATSPDGSAIVFAAISGGDRHLWLRRLGSLASLQELPGTAGADFPCWSPDGRAVAFFAQGKLKTVDAAGAAPQELTEVPLGRGCAWAPDGTILFGGSTGGLLRVSAKTRQTTRLTNLISRTARTHIGGRSSCRVDDGFSTTCAAVRPIARACTSALWIGRRTASSCWPTRLQVCMRHRTTELPGICCGLVTTRSSPRCSMSRALD
jgi:hypothetical protein